MIEIPTFQSTSANFLQEIELGLQLVQIRITWNSRVEFFFLNFTDQNGNELNGVKIVPNWPLLDWHRGTLEFVGDLIVRKTDEEAGDEITYNNFGNGWNLTYLTAAEVAAWKNDNGF
jgi:hypothetical protein